MHHSLATSVWFLVFLPTLGFTAPASNPFQPTLLQQSHANLTSFPDPSAFFTLPPSNASLGAIEHWLYPIPSTTLMLRMGAYPPHKIDRAALGRTILAAQIRVRTHIKAHGDSDLWDGDDPFEVDSGRSGKCFIGVASPSGVEGAGVYKLTYRVLEEILRGLWGFMYLGKHECEIVFKVEDRAREIRREGEELVGLGKVLGGWGA